MGRAKKRPARRRADRTTQAVSTAADAPILTAAPRPAQRAIAQCTLARPGGAVSIWWARAVGNIVWPFNTTKAPFLVEDDIGGQIAEGRNMLVSRVLSHESEAMEFKAILWIDDDVIPVSPMVLRALDSHDADIASGVYFSKEEFPQPLIFPAKGQGARKFEPDGACEAWGCGMGLTLVRVSLYKRMRDELKLPLDRNGNPEWYRTQGRDVDISRDDAGILNLGGTEDLYFCDLAARLGVKPVIDMGKHAFGFHHDLRGRTAYPRPQWEEYRKGRPIVWPVKGGDPVAWS